MRLNGLWRHHDFLKLWSGQTISQFGSQITIFVIPIVAALQLNATPIQLGLLTAAGWLPKLLIGLLVGIWIDRYKRKHILLITDIGRAFLLAIIPLSMLLGSLRIEVLYLVTFLIGILNTFFDVAYTSYLPTLIHKEQLVEGNSKLTATQSMARIAGPSFAGPLLQLLGVAFAITLDIASFLCSALFLWTIQTTEPEPKHEKKSLWQDILAGLQEVRQQRTLWALACSNGTANLFWGIEIALFYIYMLRDLKVDPTLIGTIVASQSVGILLGTFVAGSISKRIGLGPTVVLAPAFSALAVGLIALLTGPMPIIIGGLLLAQCVIGFALILYHINSMSLQQGLIPIHKQGRINAVMSFLGWSISPLGALLGGILGEHIGVRTAMIIAATGLGIALLWLIFSPIWRIHKS